MIVSLLYKMTLKLLPLPPALLHSDAAKDAELLVLRHENAVLRRQLTGPVRYEPADRFWFAALSSLIPQCRWCEVFPEQSKSYISRFLAERPQAPVSSFSAIYESGAFHPLNDLFHGIAEGPDDVADDVECLRGRHQQERFRRLMLGLFAAHRLDFLVYPTVQVVPPTREELAAEKYLAHAFPTNTVIGSQAGLPAGSIPVGFTDEGLPVGMELLGTPLAERKMLQFARAWEKAAQPRRVPSL